MRCIGCFFKKKKNGSPPLDSETGAADLMADPLFAILIVKQEVWSSQPCWDGYDHHCQGGLGWL